MYLCMYSSVFIFFVAYLQGANLCKSISFCPVYDEQYFFFFFEIESQFEQESMITLTSPFSSVNPLVLMLRCILTNPFLP